MAGLRRRVWAYLPYAIDVLAHALTVDVNAAI